MGAMIEKTAQVLSSFRIGGAGRIGAADASFGERAQNGIDGVIVQLEEFVLRALPVARCPAHSKLPRAKFLPLSRRIAHGDGQRIERRVRPTSDNPLADRPNR